MIPYNDLPLLTAEAVLAINSPDKLFINDKAEAKKAWRKLVQLWHPNKHLNATRLATEVLIKINTLYEKAEAQFEAGVWGTGKFIKWETKTSFLNFTYLEEDTILDFGIQYTGRRQVAFHVPDSNTDMVKNWLMNTDKFHTPALNPAMQKNFAPQLSARPTLFTLKDESSLIVVPKHPDFLCLKHVLAKRGQLDPVHVAWIMSRLTVLNMLLKDRDIPNLEIVPASVFINPSDHTLFLASGWQYALSFDKKAIAAPKKLARLCPGISLNGNAQPMHGSVMIKALGRECLGDPVGVLLQKRKDVPKPFTTWLNSPSNNDSHVEAKRWSEAKDASFKKQFIDLTLTEKEVYGL